MQTQFDNPVQTFQLKLNSESPSDAKITDCILSSRKNCDQQTSIKGLKESVNFCNLQLNLPRFSQSIPIKQIKRNTNIPLFQNNNENLISQLINDKLTVKNNILNKNIDNAQSLVNEMINLNDLYPISATIDSTNFILKNYCTHCPKQITNSFKVVSVNQSFVKQLNSEIERYKYKSHASSRELVDLRGRSGNFSERTFNQLDPKEDHKLNASLSNTFITNSFSSFFQRESKDKTRNKNNIKKKILNVTKRIPYVIKCMDKKNQSSGPKSVYFQDNFDKDYKQRYQRNYINVEDILMSHNVYERKEYGRYSMSHYFMKKWVEQRKHFKDKQLCNLPSSRSNQTFEVKYRSENDFNIKLPFDHSNRSKSVLPKRNGKQ